MNAKQTNADAKTRQFRVVYSSGHASCPDLSELITASDLIEAEAKGRANLKTLHQKVDYGYRVKKVDEVKLAVASQRGN